MTKTNDDDRIGKCNRLSRPAAWHLSGNCRSSSQPRGLDAAAIVDGCTRTRAGWQRTDRNVAQDAAEQTICSETQVVAGDPSKL